MSLGKSKPLGLHDLSENAKTQSAMMVTACMPEKD